MGNSRAEVSSAKRPHQEGSGVLMEYAGTLQISHHRTGTLGVPIYSLTFISGGTGDLASGRHCRGDLALVRMLEALVADADVRLHTLNQLHDEGRASIQQFVLSEAHAATYGLRRMGRAGTSAVVGRPSEAQDLERDVAGEIAAFLAESKGRCFCHTCLATLVGIEFEEARNSVYALRIWGDVRVGTARCSACHRHRVAIEAA